MVYLFLRLEIFSEKLCTLLFVSLSSHFLPFFFKFESQMFLCNNFEKFDWPKESIIHYTNWNGWGRGFTKTFRFCDQRSNLWEHYHGLSMYAFNLQHYLLFILLEKIKFSRKFSHSFSIIPKLEQRQLKLINEHNN